MKIRSLLLGSIAAAGLSTAAFAADPAEVLTSLDVCDALGLSGLTISSDTNCLQITGSVAYEFKWGNYETAAPLVTTGYGTFSVANDGGVAGMELDWDSRVTAWIKFVATADSDFGPAKAVIKIKEVRRVQVVNEGDNGAGVGNVAGDGIIGVGEGTPTFGSDTGGAIFDEAYVSIGDSTVIMAGKKGTIMQLGEDVPLNFLGLFNSEKVDTGVKWSNTTAAGAPGANAFLGDGGHVIQIVSDLGNGVSVGAALENLADTTIAEAGTAVGVISYAGDGLAAHLTLAAGGILDGAVEYWGYHAGFSGTFDIVKVVAALAGDSTGYWNGLASASATFDMFTLALSAEAVNVTTSQQATAGLDYGFGASISAAVTDGVTINLGGRWYRDASNAVPNDAWQAAVQLVAAVTETLTLTGEVGAYGDSDAVNEASDTIYGAAQVAWAPGGGFTSSLKGEVYGNGAYKATFKAAKTFE